jgi:hypothetical protein
MDRFEKKRHEIVPMQNQGRSSGSNNAALDRLMQDVLSADTASQGWLAGLAASLQEQARAGRLQTNLERIVALLEQEKKRLGALTEIRALSNELQHAGLLSDVEAKRHALERLKLEQDAERLRAEMEEFLGVKSQEREIRAMELQVRKAQLEQQLAALRTPPAPPAPTAPPAQPRESPEEYASRRADLLIKYATEIKRIRNSVDDPDLAEDLIDRFLVDIREREGR